jgi:hypothetical protein
MHPIGTVLSGAYLTVLGGQNGPVKYAGTLSEDHGAAQHGGRSDIGGRRHDGTQIAMLDLHVGSA